MVIKQPPPSIRYSPFLLLTTTPNRSIQEIETHEVCPAGKPRRAFCFVGALHSPSKSIRAFTPVSAGYAVNALVAGARAWPHAPAAGGHEGRPYASRQMRGLDPVPKSGYSGN